MHQEGLERELPAVLGVSSKGRTGIILTEPACGGYKSQLDRPGCCLSAENPASWLIWLLTP